jgi:hypothetical protein
VKKCKGNCVEHLLQQMCPCGQFFDIQAKDYSEDMTRNPELEILLGVGILSQYL